MATRRRSTQPHALIDALPVIDGYDWDSTKRELVEVKLKPTAFIREDGTVIVSADDGKGFADYYGNEFIDPLYIHPKLEEFATKRDMYWEWVNPGCIALCE